jgi:hypothetical protein
MLCEGFNRLAVVLWKKKKKYNLLIMERLIDINT